MIIIYKNPNGDTRTASKDVSYEDFQKANDMHIEDVRSVMDYLAECIENAGELHDCTKKTQEALFYKDFKNTLETGSDFIQGEWYQMHINAERHHLLSHCPEDVNLIDVLEMISDCVCAGLARSGEIRNLEIDNEILNKAVQNTVQMIKDKIEVLDPKEENTNE